jgi:Fe-S cluster assembly protein SufD
MGTRHLSSSTLTPQLLTAEQGSQLEIEVPQGDTAYLIKQSANEEQTFVFHLRHPETRLTLYGLIQAAGESAPNLTTRVLHHVSNTQADTLIRTVASGKTQPRYQGLIHIDKGAQNCESYLNHHSLILSPTAGSWSIPSLEILANEVKCSHAATVRTITETDLFYLRSRGIPADTARELLIDAFIADIPLS